MRPSPGGLDRPRAAAEPPTTRPGFPWWRYASAGLLFVLLWVGLYAESPRFNGSDAYYHVKVTQLLGREPLAPSFRWTPLSIWADGFADKELLFHLYLYPFVRAGEWMGSLFTTVELGMALLQAAALVAVLRLLDRSRVPGAFWWTLLLFGSTQQFLWRMSLVRPQVMAVHLLLIGLLLSLGGRSRWLIAVALAMPWAHTGFHALPIALLVAYVGRRLLGRTDGLSLRPLALTTAAVAAGFCAHPHFPDLAHLWFVQNVELPAVYEMAASRGLALAHYIPNEFEAWSTREVLSSAFLPVALLAAVLLLGLQGRRASDDTVSVAAVTAAFAVMLALSNRFLEYFAPLSVLVAAFYARDALAGPCPGGRLGAWLEARRRLVPILFAVAVLIPVARAGSVYVRSVPSRLPEHLGHEAAAGWLEDNTPRKARVFHASFSQFAQLFFHNHHNTYLFALDPVFFFARDPQLCELWARIGLGAVERPAAAIREQLGCRWAFVDGRRHRRLLRQLESSPEARLAFRHEGPEGQQHFVFDLRPGTP